MTPQSIVRDLADLCKYGETHRPWELQEALLEYMRDLPGDTWEVAADNLLALVDTPNPRWALVGDGESDTYLVPVERLGEWVERVHAAQDDPRTEPPPWAVLVDGALTFEVPILADVPVQVPE